MLGLGLSLCSVAVRGRWTPAPTPTPTPDPGNNPGPTLTAQSDPTAYPPMPNMATNAYSMVGDNLRVQAAATFADLLAGNNLTVNSATFALTADASTNNAGLRAALAGVTGTTYFRVRSEPTSGDPTRWSNVVLHGTAAAPNLTSPTSHSVLSGMPLARALTFDYPTQVEILGIDRIRFEIAGGMPATALTLTFDGNSAKDYGEQSDAHHGDDFDADGVYEATLKLTGLNGASRSVPITETLLYFDVTADPIAFAPVSNAALNSQQTSGEITITGVDPAATLTAVVTGGTSSKNGGPFTSADKSAVLGDKFRVQRNASANYSSQVAASLNVGGQVAAFNISTLADPNLASLVASTTPVKREKLYGDPATISNTIAFGAGQRVIAAFSESEALTAISAVIDGVALSPIATGKGFAVFIDPVARAAATVACSVTYPAGTNAINILGMTGSQLGAAGSPILRGPMFNGESQGPPEPVTVSAGGIVFSVVYLAGKTGGTWGPGINAGEGRFYDNENKTVTAGYTSGSGQPTYVFETTGQSAYSLSLTIPWAKAP